MTLADQMRSDVSDVFLDTNEHAEAILYQPKGAAPSSISAIVDRDADIALTVTEYGREAPKSCRIWCSTTDVPTVTHGDEVTIDSIVYAVEGRPSRDGYGGQWLNLRHVVRKTIGNDRGK